MSTWYVLGFGMHSTGVLLEGITKSITSYVKHAQ